jgi:3-isopropylmalate/(R)-2-methylmalate dehydratase small subunit
MPYRGVRAKLPITRRWRLEANRRPVVVVLRSCIDRASERSTVKADFEKGVVIHNGKEYRLPTLPKEVLAILNDGGLIPHVKKALAAVKH